MDELLILGSGITGLAAGMATGAAIYEASEGPGGICASYHKDGYRFETGGGHWIFGASPAILTFMESLVPIRHYTRRSAVYFPHNDLYVPYPIQNHLSFLPREIRESAIDEILNTKPSKPVTLAEWLEANFGRTLCKLFFFPFHELYTVGLYTSIAPQDAFKTPVDRGLLIEGASRKTPAVGYNAAFAYPENGLDGLIGRMASRCRIDYGRKCSAISLDKREAVFEDGDSVRFKEIVSTMPLDRLAAISGVTGGKSDPFTSVLVVNIGAKKGAKCPADHWLYIPKSRAGFHRVGFYSNVDESFLPEASRKAKDRVSIYVEKAYAAGKKPSVAQIKALCDDIVEELTDWGFIDEAEVVEPTWIETAYTWQFPGSVWRDETLRFFRERGVHSIGRYGKWKFQGIAESIADGLGMKEVANG